MMPASMSSHGAWQMAATVLPDAVEQVGHLRAALDSRAVIDQAKGILMERGRLTADEAFQALARISMTTNIKVRDVAEHLVRTGEISGG